MAILALNLPTDVAWEQICVTNDLMAESACELHHPPKWQSSIAVARYLPEEEYQVYTDRKITYLKITCTISGYQPRDKEVEGRINYSGIDAQTVSNMDSLLEDYLPCTGALIQVAVSPHTSGVPLDEYPYFMDFQPKKRELYEMVTETGERSSRSLEALKVGKASGTSSSVEVLDIDQGGSVGVSGGVEYAGVGVSGSYSESNQGQWGTKQIGAQESSVNRSADESREKRESESHTTQLSQMYHLLDSYHQGTNRAVFFVQPRPHILELPTGFVRGPRQVEGIQEFFLVVNQPKDQDGFEVSVRMDTSHLTVMPIMDYDYSRDEMVYCKADADIATEQDPADNPQQAALSHDGDRVGTIYYNCYKREAHDTAPYKPPNDYKIDVANGSYADVTNVATYGSSHVDVDAAGESLTVFCDALGHICKYEDYDITFGYWAPDNVKADEYKWAGHVERNIRVLLVSREKIKKIGEKSALLITTRQLCCGDSPYLKKGVVDVVVLNDRFGKALQQPSSIFVLAGSVGVTAQREETGTEVPGRRQEAAAPAAVGREVSHHPSSEEETRRARKIEAAGARPGSTAKEELQAAIVKRQMTAREANELTSTIRQAMFRSAGSRRREETAPVPYIETDLFHQQLRRQMLQTPQGREALARPINKVLSRATADKLARHFRKESTQLPCSRVADQSAEDLARILDIDAAQARRLKLACLGVDLREPASEAGS